MQFFTSTQANIHYRWINASQQNTVVFINALGTDLRIWNNVATQLQSHFNILLSDKQGHGLSSLHVKTARLENYATDLIELLDHLNIDQFYLIGLSVGGMIAQLIAHEHPTRVKKLILCDTRHKIGDAAGWNARIEQVKAGGVASVADAVLQRWFSEEYVHQNPEIVTGIRTMLERCNSAGYMQTCLAIRDSDLTEKARAIKHQTLCVVGSEDKSTTPDSVNDLHQLITGSKFEIIPGSGHLPCVDNPGKLSALILDFLNKA